MRRALPMRRALLWRLFLGLMVLTLAGPPLARAFLPNSIETVIKGWFSSAGKLVGLRIYESTSAPAVSGANDCRLYVDATTNDLMASCGTRAFSRLVTSAATGCEQDTYGNQICNTFVSRDQDPTVANAIRLRPNGSATARTCATSGVADQLTIIDKAANATETWCFCNGLTELSCLN